MSYRIDQTTQGFEAYGPTGLIGTYPNQSAAADAITEFARITQLAADRSPMKLNARKNARIARQIVDDLLWITGTDCLAMPRTYHLILDGAVENTVDVWVLTLVLLYGPPPTTAERKRVTGLLRRGKTRAIPERALAEGAELAAQWDQHWKDLDRSRRTNEKRINAARAAAGLLPPIQLFDFSAVLVKDPKTGKLKKVSLTGRGRKGREAIKEAASRTKSADAFAARVQQLQEEEPELTYFQLGQRLGLKDKKKAAIEKRVSRALRRVLR